MRPRERGGIVAKLLGLICIAALCFLLYMVRNPLLRMAGEYWVVEDPLAKTDAAVILSDDNFAGDRATRAVEVFHGGFAPRIIASGRRLRPYAGVAELMERDLVDRGVPKEAIVRFPQDGDNTIEEAQALLPLVTKQRWKSLIVVTSNYHTRRARYIYKRVFPGTIEIRVASARDSAYDPSNWWDTRKGLKLFFTETVGMVVAAWQLRHVGGAEPRGKTDHAGALVPISSQYLG
jgi:uncharacterized SAM-binding protein YcdF (DUF218 family)